MTWKFEFMIDTGCQVTILATSVFERMCEIHPQLRAELVPCTQLLVEALQSCLPHQLDLRTGQLWADGRSTLQLHQQKPTPTVSGSLITAVVLPPDSEVVANFSIDGGQLGTCALINPNRDLTKDFGVVVGHTLVDATTPSASVLIINPNAEEVVLPCGAHIGDLVPVLAVSVGPVGFTNANKKDCSTPRLFRGYCSGVTPLLGRYRTSIPTRFTSPVARNRSNMKLKLMKVDRYVVVHAAWHRPDLEGNRTV